jgi:acetamidase/formamidase
MVERETTEEAPMARTHYLPDDRVHYTWDTAHEPLLALDSGDTVVVNTRDVSDNQIGPDSDSSVIAGLDWDRVYPLAGPILVNGAQPGEAPSKRTVFLIERRPSVRVWKS